jgi:hypothetical protein
MGREWQRVGLGNDSRRGWLAVHGQWTLQPNSLLSGSGLGWAAKPDLVQRLPACSAGVMQSQGFCGLFCPGHEQVKADSIW